MVIFHIFDKYLLMLETIIVFLISITTIQYLLNVVFVKCSLSKMVSLLEQVSLFHFVILILHDVVLLS